jgi:hypothetical protein
MRFRRRLLSTPVEHVVCNLVGKQLPNCKTSPNLHIANWWALQSEFWSRLKATCVRIFDGDGDRASQHSVFQNFFIMIQDIVHVYKPNRVPVLFVAQRALEMEAFSTLTRSLVSASRSIFVVRDASRWKVNELVLCNTSNDYSWWFMEPNFREKAQRFGWRI